MSDIPILQFRFPIASENSNRKLTKQIKNEKFLNKFIYFSTMMQPHFLPLDTNNRNTCEQHVIHIPENCVGTLEMQEKTLYTILQDALLKTIALLIWSFMTWFFWNKFIVRSLTLTLCGILSCRNEDDIIDNLTASYTIVFIINVMVEGFTNNVGDRFNNFKGG